MDLARWFPHSITYANPASVSGFGDVAFGAAVTVGARVESRTEIVTSADGELIESRHIVWTEAAIQSNARVWLPGDDTDEISEARRVITAVSVTDRQATQTLYEIRL